MNKPEKDIDNDDVLYILDHRLLYIHEMLEDAKNKSRSIKDKREIKK